MYSQNELLERYGCVTTNSFERLERILRNDKLHMPKMVEGMIKTDILKVLSNYMKIKDSSCNFSIEIAKSGEILITFEGVADKLLSPKHNI